MEIFKIIYLKIKVQDIAVNSYDISLYGRIDPQYIKGLRTIMKLLGVHVIYIWYNWKLRLTLDIISLI